MAKYIKKYIDNAYIYSDGDIEKKMLSLVSSKNFSKKKDELLNQKPSWPIIYHFSQVRENLLRWYDFKKDASLLEVGAGCGALTGMLCSKLKNVTAIELTARRAETIYQRYKDVKNLTVITGNIADIKLTSKFDYVTCIGVLEYAGRYSNTQTPFEDFLAELKSHLAKNGTLIIAIENKFAIKYWAGAREDHTGKLFDSIENYPDNKGTQTFERNELIKMLRNVGFKKTEFYYPFPDYKMPVEIFSDEYQPTLQHNIKADVFPTVDRSQPRDFLFDEKLAMDNMIKTGLWQQFANSFLIFAS